MKRIILLASIGLFWSCSSSSKKGQEEVVHGQHRTSEEKVVKKPLSPRTSSMSNIGDNHVHIDYGSPGKRGRIIFGGLVGFGQVWATGAHKATVIHFSKDVTINAVNIPSGKYGLFTLPGESEWTVIINKDWDMHLADDYNEANDLVRIHIPVQNLDEVVESLKFEVIETDAQNGTVFIKWDQTGVAFEITTQ